MPSGLWAPKYRFKRLISNIMAINTQAKKGSIVQWNLSLNSNIKEQVFGQGLLLVFRGKSF